MSYLKDETDNYVSMTPQRIWAGVVATDGDDSTPSTTVSVIIPGMDGGELRWENCRWPTRSDALSPKRGDDCLVVLDSNAEMWITTWSPQNSQPGVGGGGGGGTLFTGHWTWTTSTTTAGTRNVGVNSATSWAAVTQVNISKTLTNNNDATNLLGQILPDDTIYLQDAGNAANWGKYKVTQAQTDHGTWVSYQVTPTSNGGVFPANNADTVVSFSVPSSPGPPGPAGQGVPPGGATGTVLTKTSAADYATGWSTVAGLPADTVVPAATRIIANKLVSSDAQTAWVVNGDGSMSWGAGGGTAPDAFLKRLSGGATPGLQATNCGISTGLASSTTGSSAGAGTYQGPGGTFGSVRSSAYGVAFTAAVLGDTGTYRWAVDNTAKLLWADGTIATADTNLYRVAPGILATDNNLRVFTGQGTTSTFWEMNTMALRYADAADSAGVFRISTHKNIGGTNNAGIAFGGGGAISIDTNLYRIAAGILQKDGSFRAIGSPNNLGFDFNPSSSAGLALRSIIGAATQPLFTATYNGTLNWGPGGSTATDTQLYRSGVNTLATSASLYAGSFNATTNASGAAGFYATALASNGFTMAAKQGTDTTGWRFTIGADGLHAWGPGAAAATDVNFYRFNPGQLNTDGEIIAQGKLTGVGAHFTSYPTTAAGIALRCLVQGESYARFALWNIDGSLHWGPGGTTAQDVNLYRYAASFLATDGGIRAGIGTALGGISSYIAYASGDTGYRWTATNNGTLNWGPGNAGTDTNLYRSSAQVLATDGQLVARNGQSGMQVIIGNAAGKGAGFIFDPSSDTNLYRSYAAGLKTDGTLIAGTGYIAQNTSGTGFYYNPATAVGSALYSTVGAEANGRFRIAYDGTHQWGPGGATAFDITLQRSTGILDTNALIRVGTIGTNPYNQGFQYAPATAVGSALTVAVSGDTANRFQTTYAGSIVWGTGAAPGDTNLYRGNAGQLQTDGTWTSTGPSGATGFWRYGSASGWFGVSQVSGEANYRWGVDVNGLMQWGPGGATAADCRLYRSGAKTLQVGAGGFPTCLGITCDASVWPFFMYDSTSAANPYFIINTGGTLSWGPKTAATDTSLYRSGVAQLTTTGAFRTNCATATSEALSVYVSGDAQLRLTMNANGTMVWGSGAAVGDTTLYRWTTAFLGTPNSFGAFMGTTSQLTLQSYNNGPIIYFGNAQDTNLYRNAVNQLRTGGSLVVDGLVTPASMGSGARDGTRFLRDDGTWQIAPAAAGALPSDCVVAAGVRIIKNLMVGTDAQPGFQLNGDGRHLWGPGGSTVPDVNLYRYAAGFLRTDTVMLAGQGFNANQVASTSTACYQASVTGDSVVRYVVNADGQTRWGPGNAATDTNLYRNAANSLRTDGSLTVMVNLGVSGATSYIALQNQNAGTNGTFYTMCTGDSYNRFVINASGGMTWGPGPTAGDTSLVRAGSGYLQANGIFTAMGAGANYGVGFWNYDGLPANQTGMSIKYDAGNNRGSISALTQSVAWRNIMVAENSSILTNGIYFGTGNTSFDTYLARPGAGQLGLQYGNNQSLHIGGSGSRGANQANEYTIAIYKSNISVTPNVGGVWGVLYVGSDNHLYYVDPTGVQRAIG